MRTGEPSLPILNPTTSLWWLRRARAEVWRFLPAWMFFVYACLLLNAELTNFSPARADLAHTVVFPLAVFVIFSVTRALWAPDVVHRRAMIASTVLLAIGLPLINVLWHRPSPVTGDALLGWYEWSNFAWAGLLLWHAWKHDKSQVALFFGVGLSYGAVLENGGILLGFFDESNLTRTLVKPFVAPVATMIGWSVVLLMATFVVRQLRAVLPWLRASALLSALAVAAFATMLDLQIDPIATASGCWVWHGSLPGWFHGVPLVNFVAWVCALAPFSWVLFRLQDVRGLADDSRWAMKDLAWGLVSVPPALVLAAASFMAVTLVLEGTQGPSWTLLNEFTLKLVG